MTFIGTSLFFASRCVPEVAELLLERGAKLDLNTAIVLQDNAVVQSLLNQPGSLPSLANLPEQLLEDAMQFRNQVAFELLLSDHRQPNAISLSRPNSLLYRAIEQAMNECDTSYLQKLLDSGLSTNVTNEFGERPLSFLAKFRAGGRTSQQADIKREVTRLLKAAGASD